MRTVIAGGHGKIAQRLERLLTARGHEAAGLIRNPGQAGALRANGAEPVVCDLETATLPEVTGHLLGADAVVFAAGAGPGSGIERKQTVDRDAAILLADAAAAAGVRRFLLVSSLGADHDPDPAAGPVLTAYLRAKAAADEAIRSRPGLDWTIVRPGPLTDDPGTGRVTLAEHAARRAIPRDDVVAVLAALLDAPATAGRSYDLVGGGLPVPVAVDG